MLQETETDFIYMQELVTSNTRKKHPFMNDWCIYKDGLKQCGFNLKLDNNIWYLVFTVQKNKNILADNIYIMFNNALDYFNLKTKYW